MTDQKKKLLKAKISLALRTVLRRKPTEQEIEKYTIAAEVLYTAVLGVHFERKQQKKNGQLAIF
jgi:hypothetical protein